MQPPPPFGAFATASEQLLAARRCETSSKLLQPTICGDVSRQSDRRFVICGSLSTAKRAQGAKILSLCALGRLLGEAPLCVLRASWRRALPTQLLHPAGWRIASGPRTAPVVFAVLLLPSTAWGRVENRSPAASEFCRRLKQSRHGLTPVFVRPDAGKPRRCWRLVTVNAARLPSARAYRRNLRAGEAPCIVRSATVSAAQMLTLLYVKYETTASAGKTSKKKIITFTESCGKQKYSVYYELRNFYATIAVRDFINALFSGCSFTESSAEVWRRLCGASSCADRSGEIRLLSGACTELIGSAFCRPEGCHLTMSLDRATFLRVGGGFSDSVIVSPLRLSKDCTYRQHRFAVATTASPQ